MHGTGLMGTPSCTAARHTSHGSDGVARRLGATRGMGEEAIRRGGKKSLRVPYAPYPMEHMGVGLVVEQGEGAVKRQRDTGVGRGQ
eukprot:366450-Chlamydomonas_euryale.AAC.37